jgi:hypothetical protein
MGGFHKCLDTCQLISIKSLDCYKKRIYFGGLEKAAYDGADKKEQ